LLAVRCNLACGKISYRVSNYTQSMKCYLEANNLLSGISDKHFKNKIQQYKVEILLGLGNIQLYQDVLTQAMKYAGQAKDLAIKINYNPGIARSWILLGHIYHSAAFIGQIPIEQGITFHEKSIDAFQSSLEFSKRIPDENLIIHALINIGGVYHDWGKFSLGEQYYMKSIIHLERQIVEDTTRIGDYSLLGGACTSLGNLFRDQGNFIAAEFWQSKGLKYAGKGGTKPGIAFSAMCLAQVEFANKKYKEAYEHISLARTIEEQIYTETGSRQLKEMEAKYQSELKDKELNEERLLRRQERFVRWSLLGGVLILMVITLILIRSYKIKQRDNRIITLEKKRSDELLLNILPTEVAEELKQYGSAQPHMFDMVTVLFSDFKGFTALAEKMTPQELVHEVNYCFSEFDKIISRYQIEKIKTIGDSYMCAGGLPVSNKTHAKDIVAAAFEMIQCIQNRRDENIAAGKPGFEMRVGINSGPVVAGIVGIKKFSYDIWGDTVNTASRMESNSEPGKVNVSHSTYMLIRDDYDCMYRGKIDVKNKGFVEMYFVNPLKTKRPNLENENFENQSL
ncbi:MAG TPA: adenylate/guanylate cyclase domain-containing protein, partial [Bacteroidales bacterium]|nr:adenylate/guanylate cyclase domain-containing protein [Bacteroidales bacterium]